MLIYLLAARAGRGWIAWQMMVLLTVVFLSYGPVALDDRKLLTSVAVWEWLLCADCGLVLWALARRVETVESRTR